MQACSVDISAKQLKALGEAIYRHCGIDLQEGKKELVHARLAKRMRTLRRDDPGEYLDGVLADPTGPEFQTLVDALTTNLTSFFREPAHFAFLRRALLPALVRKREAQRSRRIRVWSAGCSTGEEPYTLALTLLDALPDASSWDIRILATDISHAVLETARRAVYPTQRMENVPAPQQQQHFSAVRTREGASYEVAQHVRDLVRFNYLNLMKPWPFDGPLDFIFCRNVMIYFDKPTQQKLVGRFHSVLDAGGMLFTGHSESLTGIAHPFRYVEPTIYARSEGRVA